MHAFALTSEPSVVSHVFNASQFAPSKLLSHWQPQLLAATVPVGVPLFRHARPLAPFVQGVAVSQLVPSYPVLHTHAQSSATIVPDTVAPFWHA